MQNEAMLVSATLVEIEVHLAVGNQGVSMIKPPDWKSHRQPQMSGETDGPFWVAQYGAYCHGTAGAWRGPGETPRMAAK